MPRAIYILLLSLLHSFVIPAPADLNDQEFSRQGPELLLHLKANEDDRRTLKQHLMNLGSDKFLDRQKAEQTLFQTAIIPIDLLIEAEQSTNAERNSSIRRLREHMLLQLDEPLARAFAEIRKERMPGWTAEVLLAMRYCQNNNTYYVAELCLATTTTEADREILKQAITSTWRYERQLAAATLLQHNVSAHTDLAAMLLSDPDTETRLYVANLFIEAGDARGLTALASLMGDGNDEQRLYAGALLKRIAGESAPSENSASAWQRWIQTAGSGTLKKSLSDPSTIISNPDIAAEFEFTQPPINRVNNQPAKAQNLRTLGNILLLHGEYDPKGDSGEGYHFSAELPEMPIGQAYTVELEIKPAETKDTSMMICQVGGGDSWAGIMLDEQGQLGFGLLSARSSIRMSFGQKIIPDAWNHVSFSVDLKNKNILSKLNLHPTRNAGINRIQMPDPAGEPGQHQSLRFSPMRHASTPFQGQIRSLRIFRRALDRDELDELHEKVAADPSP